MNVRTIGLGRVLMRQVIHQYFSITNVENKAFQFKAVF